MAISQTGPETAATARSRTLSSPETAVTVNISVQARNGGNGTIVQTRSCFNGRILAETRNGANGKISAQTRNSRIVHTRDGGI